MKLRFSPAQPLALELAVALLLLITGLMGGLVMSQKPSQKPAERVEVVAYPQTTILTLQPPCEAPRALPEPVVLPARRRRRHTHVSKPETARVEKVCPRNDPLCGIE